MLGGSSQHSTVFCAQRFDSINARSAVVGTWEGPRNICLTVAKNGFVSWALNLNLHVVERRSNTREKKNIYMWDKISIMFENLEQPSRIFRKWAKNIPIPGVLENDRNLRKIVSHLKVLKQLEKKLQIYAAHWSNLFFTVWPVRGQPE